MKAQLKNSNDRKTNKKEEEKNLVLTVVYRWLYWIEAAGTF